MVEVDQSFWILMATGAAFGGGAVASHLHVRQLTSKRAFAGLVQNSAATRRYERAIRRGHWRTVFLSVFGALGLISPFAVHLAQKRGWSIRDLWPLGGELSDFGPKSAEDPSEAGPNATGPAGRFAAPDLKVGAALTYRRRRWPRYIEQADELYSRDHRIVRTVTEREEYPEGFCVRLEERGGHGHERVRTFRECYMADGQPAKAPSKEGGALEPLPLQRVAQSPWQAEPAVATAAGPVVAWLESDFTHGFVVSNRVGRVYERSQLQDPGVEYELSALAFAAENPPQAVVCDWSCSVTGNQLQGSSADTQCRDSTWRTPWTIHVSDNGPIVSYTGGEGLASDLTGEVRLVAVKEFGLGPEASIRAAMWCNGFECEITVVGGGDADFDLRFDSTKGDQQGLWLTQAFAPDGDRCQLAAWSGRAAKRRFASRSAAVYELNKWPPKRVPGPAGGTLNVR